MQFTPDDSGFAAWYGQEASRLSHAVAAMIGDAALAEEAVAEASARAYSRWKRVSAMDSPSGWVVRVSLNIAKSRFRRLATARRKARMLVPATEIAPPEFDDRLWGLVAKLPERSRHAVVLRYVADLPESDVADVLGVTRSTVATLLSRARGRLREQLVGEDAS